MRVVCKVLEWGDGRRQGYEGLVYVCRYATCRDPSSHASSEWDPPFRAPNWSVNRQTHSVRVRSPTFLITLTLALTLTLTLLANPNPNPNRPLSLSFPSWFPSRVLGSPPLHGILFSWRLVLALSLPSLSLSLSLRLRGTGFRVIISSLSFPPSRSVALVGVRPFSPSPGPRVFLRPPRISSCTERTRLSFSRSHKWRRWHLPQHTTRTV